MEGLLSHRRWLIYPAIWVGDFFSSLTFWGHCKGSSRSEREAADGAPIAHTDGCKRTGTEQRAATWVMATGDQRANPKHETIPRQVSIQLLTAVEGPLQPKKKECFTEIIFSFFFKKEKQPEKLLLVCVCLHCRYLPSTATATRRLGFTLYRIPMRPQHEPWSIPCPQNNGPKYQFFITAKNVSLLISHR